MNASSKLDSTPLPHSRARVRNCISNPPSDPLWKCSNAPLSSLFVFNLIPIKYEAFGLPNANIVFKQLTMSSSFLDGMLWHKRSKAFGLVVFSTISL